MKQFFRDLVRPKSPPPDERPAEPFPHAFLTPRAVRDILAFEAKRGRTAVVLFNDTKDGSYGYVVTTYGNLVHDECVRMTCPEVPCYITKTIRENYAGFIVDHVPLRNDPPGTRTPGNPKYLDFPFPTDSAATGPGLIRLSFAKLARLHPELLMEVGGTVDGVQQMDFIIENLLFGDTNPGLVATIEPELIVAAYAVDIDCVVLLRFPREFAVEYNLKPGARLVSINSYYGEGEFAPDLKRGPRYLNWFNVIPMIGEFLADDVERLAILHRDIPETKWQRCRELTVAALKSRPLRPRDGRPLRCEKPVV